MIGAYCTSLRRDLAAFVDDELRGDRVLSVLSHLEHCTECSEYVEMLRTIGDGLRAEAPAEMPVHVLDGLAATVISRTKAETQQSWLAAFRRAHEDWRWPLVAAGAVSATFVSTMVLSAILAFGPRPQVDDSLSATIANYGTPAGTLFLVATPVGDDQQTLLMQVEDGSPAASRAVVQLASRSADRAPSEAQLVDALADIVTRNGRAVPLNQLTKEERGAAEFLLQEISRIRAWDTLRATSVNQLNVVEVRLVASASVSAGL